MLKLMTFLLIVQPAPPQVDLGRLGGVLKSIHHSIRLRNRHNPATLATITDNALKDVFNHVSDNVVCCVDGGFSTNSASVLCNSK